MLEGLQYIVPMYSDMIYGLWVYVLSSMGVKHLMLLLTKCLAAFCPRRPLRHGSYDFFGVCMLGGLQNIVPVYGGIDAALWMYALSSVGVSYAFLLLTKCLADCAHVPATRFM